MKKWTDHETHFNVNEHANETVDCDSSGSITWGHKYLVYVHDIYTYIYYIWSIYDDAERPAVYFDGCLSSEWSQLNCVTWKCLNIIKANLIIIIEARRTTTNKCSMKEAPSYLRCSDGFWCCASYYKYVVGTTLGSECVIVWVTQCSSSAWV